MLECLIYSDLTNTLINVHNSTTSPASVVLKKYPSELCKKLLEYSTPLKSVKTPHNFNLEEPKKL